jgi:hypothetical protein
MGNYIFLSSDFYSKWSIVFLILLFLLCIIPHENLIKYMIGRLIESDVNQKSYLEAYFDFNSDYERANPLTFREGYNTYLKNLKERDIITSNEFIRMITIINNDESWKFLRTRDRDVNLEMNLKSRRMTLFERILGAYNNNIELHRLRIKAVRLFQNVLNIINPNKTINDFEALISEIEKTLLMNDICIGQKDALKAFKRNLARSKMAKENLKTEYAKINTREYDYNNNLSENEALFEPQKRLRFKSLTKINFLKAIGDDKIILKKQTTSENNLIETIGHINTNENAV